MADDETSEDRFRGIVADIEAIRSECPTEAFDTGVELLRQGEPGEHMFVIVSGAVEISVDARPIAVLGRGETVGEMALVDDAPRNATATARAPTEAIRIDRKNFIELRRTTPRFVDTIMRIMAERIRRTSTLAASVMPAPPEAAAPAPDSGQADAPAPARPRFEGAQTSGTEVSWTPKKS